MINVFNCYQNVYLTEGPRSPSSINIDWMYCIKVKHEAYIKVFPINIFGDPYIQILLSLHDACMLPFSRYLNPLTSHSWLTPCWVPEAGDKEDVIFKSWKLNSNVKRDKTEPEIECGASSHHLAQQNNTRNNDGRWWADLAGFRF